VVELGRGLGSLGRIEEPDRGVGSKHVSDVIDNVPDIRVFNTYGPVENMCQSTAFEANLGWSSAAVPIGRPVVGKQAMVLDEYLQPVPPGASGEMYLCGRGLAHGYVSQPAHTAERFVANPYGQPGERMYRTGDLVHRGTDGILEFLGRIDQQVKLRGYRVEPAEIRAVLLLYPGLRQAEVVVMDGQSGEKRLVAYVVPAPGAEIDADELRNHCLLQLPDYLVPSSFVIMTTIPLTANGKLDRAALPMPDMSREVTGRAPRSSLEKALCGLYAKLLGVPEVSIDDNFFALGGDSLLAMRLVSRIRKTLALEATVEAVFANPTVDEMTRQLNTPGTATISLSSWVRERRS
jgi:aryl carrier-like protein